MKKFLVYMLLVALAMVVAGVYGIVHDQISYTIAPEYFTKFKFEQFGLVSFPLPERVRASIVGFFASWWMGIPIGLLVGAAGFIHRDPREMLRATLWSFLVVVGFTLLVGLAGLLYGAYQTRHINIADYDNWYIPDGVIHLRRFLCAGYMHNSAYLGGALAIPAGWIYHIIVRWHTKYRGPVPPKILVG